MNDVANRLGLDGHIDEGDLITYLEGRRWFSGRSRDIAGLDVIDAVALPGDDPKWLVIVELGFETGTHETYQLVLSLLEPSEEPDAIAWLDDRPVIEAGETPELARLLVEAPATGTSLQGTDGSLELWGIGPRYDASRDAPVRPLKAEQSNTSLVVGDSLLVKMYRRLEPGLNPELEMLLFLTERDFAFAPHVAGWYSYTGTHLRANLGLVQRFLPDARDGWSLALEEVPTSPDAFLDRLDPLGAILGELHRVLASDGDDAAFAPEDPTSETSGLLTATIEEQIDAVYAVLPEDDDVVAAIAGRADELREIARRLAPAVLTGRLIRTHGDLHLAQAVWSGDHWYITDFEGEPDRSISDRRRKMLPLRDVAGMFRSFAYLVETLARGAIAVPDGFEAEARSRFLGSYRDSVEGAQLLPSAEGVQERLVDLFELEKVLYEIRYEIAHRPELLAIPVQGLLQILERNAA